MSGLALFRRNSPSQALVQAPSADLIKSDNEFSPPEPEEIRCELTAEDLRQYSTVANKLLKSNNALRKEHLWHTLHSRGFKNYPVLKVNSFMANQVSHAARKGAIAPDIWWRWINIQNYKHPIPPQIIKKIELINSSKKGVFLISDIISITSRYINQNTNTNTDKYINNWEQVVDKRSTEICFLRIDLHESAGPKESLIIDAWRGPTFSDEEAKI